MSNETPQAGFYGLGIAPGILSIIDRMKFKTPTPIQQKAIPIAVEGNDVLGIAQTGTGKTLAFGIPMMQRLAQGPGKALVLVPTRELALQVDETLNKLGQPFNARTAILIGGMSISMQVQALRKANTRILIATPGRLLDHIEHRVVNLSDLKIVVLDEADRMLDMGFAPQIHAIMKAVPKERQTLFFSATMPEEIMKIASTYMKLPVRVEIAHSGSAPEKIVQELFIVKQESKRGLLLKLLGEFHGSVLVFSRTKINAKKIAQSLRQMNFSVNEIHSNRSLGQRREALEGFKTGKYRVLVATDIAARGIDVKGIELVINYDLPDDTDNYVHRIGRTGRAGREGRAISFATPDQGGDIRGIERVMRTTLKVATHPEFPSENFIAGASSSSSRGRSQGGHKSRSSHSSGGNRPFKSWDKPRPSAFTPREGQGPSDSSSHSSSGNKSFKPWDKPKSSNFTPRDGQRPSHSPSGNRPFKPWDKPRSSRPHGNESSSNSFGGNKPFTPRDGQRPSSGNRPFKPWDKPRPSRPHGNDQTSSHSSGGNRPFKPWDRPKSSHSSPSSHGGNKPFTPRGDGQRPGKPRFQKKRQPGRFF